MAVLIFGLLMIALEQLFARMNIPEIGNLLSYLLFYQINSGQMLLLCDDSVILPLKIIFRNILLTSIYRDTWKLANVTPIFKKGDKQQIKYYRPISLLPICGKIFEKNIFNNLYSYLNLVFVQVTLQLTNSYILSMKFIKHLRTPNP